MIGIIIILIFICFIAAGVILACIFINKARSAGAVNTTLDEIYDSCTRDTIKAWEKLVDKGLMSEDEFEKKARKLIEDNERKKRNNRMP